MHPPRLPALARACGGDATIAARVILKQAPCQLMILMILASWTIPAVAAVNGLVADRHLGMSLLYIPHFVRAPAQKGVSARGCGGWDGRDGVGGESGWPAASRDPLRKNAFKRKSEKRWRRCVGGC